MRVPAAIEHVIVARRSGIALLLFALGLLALPAAFTAGSIYHRSGEPGSWRPALDYFEWLSAAIGLLCCIAAPFVPEIPARQRIFLSLGAVGLYAIDLGVSAVGSIMVFGPSF